MGLASVRCPTPTLPQRGEGALSRPLEQKAERFSHRLPPVRPAVAGEDEPAALSPVPHRQPDVRQADRLLAPVGLWPGDTGDGHHPAGRPPPPPRLRPRPPPPRAARPA